VRSKRNAGEWSGTPSAADSSSFVTVGSIVCVADAIAIAVALRAELVERALRSRGSTPGRRRRDVERLDRHRDAVGEREAA
jgi:hypothetical protein